MIQFTWNPEIHTFFLSLTKKKKKSVLQLFVGAVIVVLGNDWIDYEEMFLGGCKV